MKLHSNLSKVFSRSIFRAMRPRLLLEVEIVCMISCVRMIASFSSRDKVGLVWVYEIREKGFEPLNKEFCYCFVESIAQENGAELVDGF